MSQEPSVDTLLDALGSRTRRQILELLAEEPKYLLQLSKELSVSPAAIQKHLEVLKRGGFVRSYKRESDLAAPPRIYYQLKSAIYLMSGIAEGFVKMEAMPIVDKGVEEPEEIAEIREEARALERIEDRSERLQEASRLLANVDGLIQRFNEINASLLSLRRTVLQIANGTIRQVSRTNLEKRVLRTILGSLPPPDVETLSVTLDVRERTIEDVLQGLDRRKLLPTKRAD